MCSLPSVCASIKGRMIDWKSGMGIVVQSEFSERGEGVEDLGDGANADLGALAEAGGLRFEFDLFLFAGGNAGVFGGLILGAQPADEASLLFFGAFVIERDEALEKFLFELLSRFVTSGEAVGEGLRLGEILPAVGLENGGIEVVVDLLEDGDEALVVDLAFLVGEGSAGAELFKHVVLERKMGTTDFTD